MTFDRLINWDRDTALAAAPRLTWLHPNWITTGSLVLALAGLTIIAWGPDPGMAFLGAALVFVSRWADWIDGYVARATGTATNLGGLYDIAVGYVTMVLVMVAIGLRQDDMALSWCGAVAAILLRIVLMAVGWTLGKRQRLAIVPWNPQKLLTPRQPRCMRRMKTWLDALRNDYAIALFGIAGGAGLHIWGWVYTTIVAVLTFWVLGAACFFVRRVHPAAPRHTETGEVTC